MKYAVSTAGGQGEGTLLDDLDAPHYAAGGSRAAPLLLEYWQIVRRRKWLIAAMVVAALVAGLVVTMLITPQYTAGARLAISRDQQRVTNVEGIESGDANREAEFYETQYGLLRSRSVAERVARELRLARNDAFFDGHGVAPAGEGGAGSTLTRDQLAAREKQAVELLLNNVAIAPIARSSLVDVRYTSAAPVVAADVANSWASAFIADSIERRFDSTADARKFLEGRLADLRSKVQSSETDLVDYANANNIVILDRVTEDGKTVSTPTLTAVNLTAMNSALAEATAQRVALQSRARTSGASNSLALGNSAINSLRQRRAELAGQYADLMVQFEPGYPAARAIQQQIAELDKAIGREEGRTLQSIQGDYRSAVERENDLRQRVNQLTGEFATQERAKIQYNIFQNEVDTNRQLYDGLLQRYKEIGVAGVAANNVAVVDQAQVPVSPSYPILPLNLALSLLAGLALAGTLVFILEQLDEGIRSPADIPRELGIPLLGAIPAVEQNEEQDIIAQLSDPKSELSEAYLTVRSNLSFVTGHGVPHSMMITSSRPSEGKSTTSFALAAVLARTGRRVLLIDGDMRSPSLHHLVGVPNDAGLSSALSGNEDWRTLTRKTDLPGLTMLTAGRVPPSAAELLSTDRVRKLLDETQKEFDHVVIDAPPLLGLADSTLLARAVEGAIYVVEAGGLPARSISASLDRLRDTNAHLFGAVLTKLPVGKDDAYGYGYGYGVRYGETAGAR